MFAQLPLTEMLAAFIGLYFAAAGIGLMVSPDAYSKMIQALLENPMASYISGLMAFLIGATVVGLHDRWSDFLSGAVSLVGWIALAEGVLMLAVPHQFIGFFAKINITQRVVRAIGIATFTAGLSLLAAIVI